MNKKELITSMSEKTELTKKDVELALNAFIETVEETLENGEKVQLTGFGVFEPRQRKARMGRNPKTGEELEIPASVVPAFKVGKAFKERVKEANR
ncbi:transcriptional regulator (plasmid) [Clostridium tetani]|uniref:HU family DNA-binding protein n=1 Tax=Clostridium tetani TaxID=1513 RepID=UPI00295399F8|nr:HU family DNA-binding protein [Clostridium tetani]BDR74174.1 transcriptional regulator [Clostridium tetani]